MALLSEPVSRRRLLNVLGAAATAAALERRHVVGQSDDLMPNVLTGIRLEPFVDALVIPAVLRGSNRNARPLHHQIKISEFRQKLHRDLPESIVWGFDGSTPGPTIEARRGQAVMIDWVNRLPFRHRLFIDHTLCGAGSDVPEVRTTIHLHGGHVSPENDGYPEDWITPSQTRRTVYPNEQGAAMLWYHDHAMGITRLNALMGLAGLYLIREPGEDALALPSGTHEIPIVLQDRILDARGQLAYPLADTPDAPSVPEFFGTHILVNGRVSPFIEVEPRLYRLRILNAANARVFRLTLEPEQVFFQIGTDGGLLSEPAARHELLIAPGERCDVLVDFRGREGHRIMIVNDAPAPYPTGGAPVPGPVMQFRILQRTAEDKQQSRIVEKLANVPRLEQARASKTRRLTLMETMPEKGRRHTALLDGKRFTDPISEDPIRGSLEIWEFVNTTADAHPIHLHAVHFQVLDRCPFDTRLQQSTSKVLPTRKPTEPPPYERGWKDTVLCPPGQITRIITPFAAEPGRYVWHCHMLEHEDNEMMRPYVVRP